MCDIGFCVAKIIRGNEYEGSPCLEACNFNSKQVETKIIEKRKIKREVMSKTIIKGKRK